MKPSLIVAGVACMLIAIGVIASIYYYLTFITGANPATGGGMNLPPGVNPGPRTIFGVVMDKNNNGISGATVALYNVTVIDGYPISNCLADIANNPRTTSRDAIAGFFAFEGVSSGYYNITAEKDGHMWFAIVNVTGIDASGINHNVVIPDYLNRPSDA